MAQKLIDLVDGDKIKLGKYQVSTETPQVITWQIAGKNLYGDNTVTFISEKILDLRAFDGKEPNNPDSSRKQYGNNKYSVSNIDQWLNSKEQDWYKPQHDYDTYPDNTNTANGTGYNTRPGFLYNFSDDEVNMILTSNIKVALNTVTDGGSYEVIPRKIFLPSTTEMGLANENNIVEGTKFMDGLTKANSNRLAYLTSYAFNNTASTSKPSGVTSAWYYWLRTPHSGSSCNSRDVGSSGTLGYDRAYNGFCGVRPALTLSGNILVSDTKGSDGCYSFVQMSKVGLEMSKPIITTQRVSEVSVAVQSTCRDLLYSTKVSACNNGFDTEPVWEDITEHVINKEPAVLVNSIKEEDKNWGLKLKIDLEKESVPGKLSLRKFVISYR